MSPPAQLETTTQCTYRKAQVRRWYMSIIDWAFSIAAVHLGGREAARILLAKAQALAKPYPGKDKDNDTADEDSLRQTVEMFPGSPLDAARYLYEHHGARFGNSVGAIEKSISRLPPQK
jgi:hypothetical protein